MKDILKKAKIPIIIIALLFLGFLVYNTVFKKEEPTSGIETTGGISGDGRKSPSQDFLPLLNLIKNVDFDEKFFDDIVFKSMVDFSEPVREEQKGRDNPFAPGILSSYENVTTSGVDFDASASNRGASSSPRTPPPSEMIIGQ